MKQAVAACGVIDRLTQIVLLIPRTPFFLREPPFATGKAAFLPTIALNSRRVKPLDFARLMSEFGKHDSTFVSVTQQFNTSTVGRLTVHILPSFAQFEREIISET